MQCRTSGSRTATTVAGWIGFNLSHSLAPDVQRCFIVRLFGRILAVGAVTGRRHLLLTAILVRIPIRHAVATPAWRAWLLTC